MKIIKSEDSLDRFNEAGLAEVLKSSLRKYKCLVVYLHLYSSTCRSQEEFTVCARVYIYQFPIEIKRPVKWFTILSTEGPQNLILFIVLAYDSGEKSDDLHYLIPTNFRSKKSVTFISLNGDFVKINADLEPAIWNRFCFLVNKSGKRFSLYINDEMVYKADDYPAEFDAGNLWLLGSPNTGQAGSKGTFNELNI